MAGSIGRILVTGAAGFVGQHLLAALRETYPHAELLTPRFDVTDPTAADQALHATRPDAVIHLAAIAASPEAKRDPERAWEVNLHGTLRLARAVMAHAPHATLVFAGSGDCYGASFRPGTPLDENAPMAPMNVYGATKAAADLALGAMAAEGLRVVRARPFNHTGPGQSDAFVVPAFARQVMRIAAGLQPPMMEVGALDPEKDFLDVRDICNAYAACLAADLEPGTILNLASGQPRGVGDVLRQLLDLANVQAEIRTDPTRLRAAEIKRAIGNATRAQALLGWKPAIPWETTLHDVLEDWRTRTAA